MSDTVQSIHGVPFTNCMSITRVDKNHDFFKFKSDLFDFFNLFDFF